MPSVLIGQGLTVSLVTPGMTQSAWSWSISGDPFAGFQVTGSTGNALELGATHMLTSEGFTYYYRSIQDAGPDTSTIACTATVTDPNGDVHQATGTTQVSVYAPTYTQAPQAGAFNIGNGQLEAGFPNGNGGPPGILFVGSVTVPAPFAAGMFGYAQLITNLYTWAWTSVGNIPTNQATATMSTNGQNGLDTGFTYGGFTNPASGVRFGTSDTPGTQLPKQPWVQVTMNDSFTTYMLYQPASAGNQPTTWVPLCYITWVADGTAAVGAGGWAVQGSPVVTITAGNVATKTLPSWTNVVSAGSWQYQ